MNSTVRITDILRINHRPWLYAIDDVEPLGRIGYLRSEFQVLPNLNFYLRDGDRMVMGSGLVYPNRCLVVETNRLAQFLLNDCGNVNIIREYASLDCMKVGLMLEGAWQQRPLGPI